MNELQQILEKLIDMSGQDFVLLTAGAAVTDLDLHLIVPNAATVFASITGKGAVDLLTTKGIGSTEIGAGMPLPFYKLHVTGVQITSGSALGYYK